jgi:hypothetical protein
MHETLNEKVDVFAVFSKNKLRPLIVKWNNKEYRIQKVNLEYHAFDGRESVHYFSVSDNANYFKLAFYTKRLQWYLEELYTDG